MGDTRLTVLWSVALNTTQIGGAWLRYAPVYTQFWRSKDVKQLSPPARTLFLYLLTSPHSNMVGYYYLPLDYAAKDMQVKVSEVAGALTELKEKEHVSYDEGAEVILIRNYLSWNKINGPKQAEGAKKAAEEVPESLLLAEWAELAKRFCPEHLATWNTLSIPYRYPIDTPSIPVSVSVSESVPETEKPAARTRTTARSWWEALDQFAGRPISPKERTEFMEVQDAHGLDDSLIVSVLADVKEKAKTRRLDRPLIIARNDLADLGIAGVRTVADWEAHKTAKSQPPRASPTGRTSATAERQSQGMATLARLHAEALAEEQAGD